MYGFTTLFIVIELVTCIIIDIIIMGGIQEKIYIFNNTIIKLLVSEQRKHIEDVMRQDKDIQYTA